jgi:hypothetical protein
MQNWNLVAEGLVRDGRRDDAIRVLELNKEFHPGLPSAWNKRDPA